MAMHAGKQDKRLAQSASALGAAILGFGLGAKWGNVIDRYAYVIIILGAIIHVAGMYLVQMKDATGNTGIMKLLWISAWICLVALVAIVLYMLF
jgi:hypothetical protein